MLREKAVKRLFEMDTFNDCYIHWEKEINKNLGTNPDFHDILNLGDSLGSIFSTTAPKNKDKNKEEHKDQARTQSSLSGGGAAWEGLVCWYLNLCFVGSRTVVIKYTTKLIPECIRNAMAINYHNVIANTESDLVAITFPEETELLEDVTMRISKKKHAELMNELSKKHFRKLQVGNIQCKTNWKDNAQIPMLWDMVYSLNSFNDDISTGLNNFYITKLDKFFYSFVTVPSNGNDVFKSDNLHVKRLYNLSGGNYWGRPSQSGVAHSIKEIFNRNFSDSWCLGTQEDDVESALKKKEDLAYFKLFS